MRQPENTYLAEVNVATAVDDMDSKQLADFVANLDRINALAERSEGFVWRLQDETGNASNIQVTDNSRFIVNLSVWETPEHLEHFVWNTVHKRIYAKKSKWFEVPIRPHFAMWWVRRDHLPTTDEALERLAELHANGPGEQVFGWESLPNVTLWKKQRCA